MVLNGLHYPEHPVEGIGMMIVFCILLSPIFTYIRLKAGSVLAVSILHGTINGVIKVPLIVLKGGNDLLIGMTGLAGFIVLLIVDILLLIDKSTRSVIEGFQ